MVSAYLSVPGSHLALLVPGPIVCPQMSVPNYRSYAAQYRRIAKISRYSSVDKIKMLFSNNNAPPHVSQPVIKYLNPYPANVEYRTSS
jgi:hypothetical protein